MINVVALADRTIPKSTQSYHLRKKDFITDDIIDLIAVSHSKATAQTKDFAKNFPGETLEEKTNILYHFLLTNIRYKEDEPGYQFIKLPSAVWHDKYCDCKSFSLFIGGILENWKIPFVYRFTSYSPNDIIPRHVYPVIKIKNQEIIMDVVYKKYNQQKKLINKPIDLNMKPGLYYVSGIGTDDVRVDLQGRDIADISEAEMDLLIAKDRMETMKEITEKKRGVGSLIGEKYQDSIDLISDALDAVRNQSISGDTDIEVELGLIADNAVEGKYSIAGTMFGIGAAAKKAKRAAKKVERKKTVQAKKAAGKKGFSNLKNRTQKALKKVAAVAKKGAKAVLKVSSLPMRLTAKAVLEVMLPKAAPYFLYLFINDPAMIAKLPEPIKKKRAKQERIADFIVNVIGMKRQHFMGIVRNGIMKQMGASPETILAGMFGASVKGIGIVGAAVSAAFVIIKKAAPALIKLVKFIFSKLGKKHSEEASEDDAASLDDFANGTGGVSASDIKGQDANQEIINNPDLEGNDSTGTGGGSFWNTMK